MDFLPRLIAMKPGLIPGVFAAFAVQRNWSPPPGASTLITSAPRSARICVA